jgi:hypothetical protein
MHRQEFTRAIELPLGQRTVPRPGGDIGQGVVVPRQVAAFGQQPVEHVHLPLDLHRIAVDGVLQLLGRIGIEVPEAAAQEGRTAHLPEQPAERLGTRRTRCRQEGPAELLRQIHEDGPRLEHPHRLGPAAVHEGRDLGIGVHLDKAAAELLAFVDADQPGVVFRAAVAQGQQLFQQDGDLHAIGRAERIELQRMAAHRQLTLVRGAGNRTVDVGELTATGGVPGPDLGRRVVRHEAFRVSTRQR